MELFDSHSHYNDEQFDVDREEIIKEVYDAGVTKLITAGYNLESSKQAVEIASSYDFIYAIVGVSPNDIEELPANYLEQIENLARNKKVVAIGEIGLDYHWSKENKDTQQEIFIKQIELANKLKLPIVIHTTDAIMDTIDTFFISAIFCATYFTFLGSFLVPLTGSGVKYGGSVSISNLSSGTSFNTFFAFAAF